MEIDLSAINAVGDGIKWLYRKTGYFGHLALHYVIIPNLLVLLSIVISVYLTVTEPITITEALLYTVVVRFSMTQYKAKSTVRKGTN